MGAQPIGTRWMTVQATVVVATAGKGVVVDSVDVTAGTLTFKTYDLVTGAAAAGVTFTYELIDNGGSTSATW
jgi:hypothetical protein